MKNVLIIVCSGTFNRGTEALVRGTIILLEKAFGEIKVTLSSSTPEEDALLKLPFVSSYIPRITRQKCSLIKRIANKILIRVFHERTHNDYSGLVNCAKTQDIVLSVGADNYDIAYKLFEELHYLNKQLRQKCKGKLFLYDCSLNKESVTTQFIDEAKMFDAFSVRESETLENLRGVYDGDNLHFLPDPAFVMPAKDVELPHYWKKNNMVGINLSTLIVGEEYGEGLHDKVVSSYKYMMDRILDTSPLDIVLIPHVMKRKDLEILEELSEFYVNNSRVHLISNENYTAPEIKYLISNCRFFVGARTHATIAAYSSCVPTIVLGYSTKSIGIAKDLFGTTDGYVVPVQKLENKEELWEHFFNIMNNEEKIKSHLKDIMSDYKAKVYSMSDIFKRLLS